MFAEIVKTVFFAAVEQAWREIPPNQPVFKFLLELDRWLRPVSMAPFFEEEGELF